MPKAAFVLAPRMLASSITWPMDMLVSANQAARRLLPEAAPFEMIPMATTAAVVVCHNGLTLAPQTTVSNPEFVDIIFLPALWRNPQTVIRQSPEVLEWLQRQFENGAIISGVGTGCCFMAAAGLLDNKPATTHWHYFDLFQRHYPLVQLKRQHFITQAGKLYCAASVNSLADLTVHFIQRFFSQSVAQHVQRHFSHEVRQAYEAVSYLEDDNTNHPDEEVLQAQLWLHNNMMKAVTISKLARQFGMSPRNFSRRFKAAAGKTPVQYLHQLRLNTARELLQSSNLSIAEIAEKAGFQDASHFSRLFRRTLSISPRDYRTTVRAKLFSAQVH